ncbi:C2H2 type zinc finger domain-containing protein [Lentinula edodes]|uniref:C2H2 type zinc finger domain-containing protein n=1 Tax=Lentinula edodes TaxID=5353 RepID=A0A1Q3ER80_LENED|nr:C2H2 type zinc finger domain-containing protein [Lentinula edodes]
MSHSQDLEAPTIFVEAPPEDEQGDLIDGGYLNSTFHEHSPELQALFLQMYPEVSPSSMNIPGTSSASFDQSLFSASFDQSSSTGQISPLITAGLREGSAGNVFLAPNDQSSPIDPAWSPASSFEGDGKDGWSDGSSAWSPSVQSSSPSPSSPSLSPLNTSFNNIILSDDNVAATTSPHSLVGAVDPFFSPGISSSSGSSQLSLPITIQGHDSEPELIPVQYSGGVARRHSFAGSRSPSGSRSASPLPESSSNASDSLHRAISDPIGQNRRRRAPTVPRKYPGLLKPAKEVDEAGPSYPDSSMMINVPIEGVHSAPAPAEFKTVVGSNKIVEASKARRKNEAKFKCDICNHRFTAKHNLQNHMNSHSNRRPHECQKCGNTFTTRGTHARHETICAGRAVRKRL